MIYADNSNTVDIFSFLQASSPYNQLLVSAMKVVLDHNIDFWVLHIRGADNIVVDALSHFENDLAISLYPGLIIQSFQPPQDALGAPPK